ncbi:MAG: ATP-binding protein [Nitrospira sp.]|nr:ATP-binding protein [Nitrospira sp.]
MRPVESLGVEEQAGAGNSAPHSPLNRPQKPRAGSVPSPTLRRLALSAVAALAEANPTVNHHSPEWGYLTDVLKKVPSDKSQWKQSVLKAVREPSGLDQVLVQLAGGLSCTVAEVLAVALAAAVDEDLIVGRVLAFLQAPVGGSRPTLGLLASAYADLVEPGRHALDVFLTGSAIRSGLLQLGGDDVPVPERVVLVPQAIGLALRGHDGVWPGTAIGMSPESAVALPPSVHETARQHARSITSAQHQSLLIRSGFLAEAKSAATAVAAALSCRPLFIETEKVSSMGPWLMLRGLIPVFVVEAAPGERKNISDIPEYIGPVLAVTSSDGSIERAGEAMPCWLLPIPGAEERYGLWQRAIGNGDSAKILAQAHRHSSGRIQMLGGQALRQAALQGRAAPDLVDVVAASVTGTGTGLDTLAQPLRESIPEEALVVPPLLRRELDVLELRCRLREGLAETLGAAVTMRYRPGVRALFVGPSGTGKTLAAGWLATKLGLPLYRVDLASVTSKYIGETEKNLAQLFAQAERSDVVLLFDEADSLFGKRTEIKDSNDRFANAQTNYVLQRIESYDGIVLLTSNSRSRFDGAFSRRLDMILEFPAPGPEERRGLWVTHLGAGHQVTSFELNRLAATVDMAGGHIRNVVLTAAVLAQHAGRPIAFADLVAGLSTEFRKVGRQMPSDLVTTSYV